MKLFNKMLGRTSQTKQGAELTQTEAKLPKLHQAPPPQAVNSNKHQNPPLPPDSFPAPPPPPHPPRMPGGGVRLIEFPPTAMDKAGPKENGSTPASKRAETKPDTEPTEKPALGAVIVTIWSGSSYDELFRHVPQKGEDNEVVRVYECKPEYVEFLVECLQEGRVLSAEALADSDAAAIQAICDDIRELDDPDAVVFNYECCSDCSDTGFGFGNHKPPKKGSLVSGLSFLSPTQNEATSTDLASTSTIVFKHIQYFLNRGYMVMCSDFSLKALISRWDEAALGPNPFELVSSTGRQVKLRFNSKQLSACPSSQLQTVGDLLPDQDWLLCNVMSCTIVYTVKDPQKQAAASERPRQAESSYPFGEEPEAFQAQDKFQLPQEFGAVQAQDNFQMVQEQMSFQAQESLQMVHETEAFQAMDGADEVLEPPAPAPAPAPQPETEMGAESSGRGAESADGTDVAPAGAPYRLEVLTVAEVHTHSPCTVRTEAGAGYSGAAGHCVLTYPSGGRLLTSMTHWAELAKMEVSEEKLFECAREAYGAEYAEAQRSEYSRLDAVTKQQWLTKASNSMVQQQAPAMSKAKKSKMKAKSTW